jgi:hypothetical protein
MGAGRAEGHAVGLAGRALGLLGQGIALGRGQNLERQARAHQELARGVHDLGADALARQSPTMVFMTMTGRLL